MVKIQKPKFINLEDVQGFYDEVIYAEEIVSKIVEGYSIEGKNERGLTIDSCKFKNVVFTNCSFENLDLIDTRFESCDLSNVNLSNSGIHRVEFVNCKLVGTRFDESNIKDVLIKDSIGRYSNFSFSKVNGMNILNSDFEEATFQEVKHKKLSVEESSFINAYCNKTSFEKVDLTSCDIDGINVDIEDVRGAIVTTMQALHLTKLLNLQIK